MTKILFFPNPLSGKAEERVNKRSEVGVSRITNNSIPALRTNTVAPLHYSSCSCKTNHPFVVTFLNKTYFAYTTLKAA